MSLTVVDNYKLQMKEIAFLIEENNKKLQIIENDNCHGNVAIIIQNQDQYIKKMGDKIPNFLKMISIPSSMHILSALPNIFSLQACRSETDNYYYFSKAGDVDSMKIAQCNLSSIPSIIMKNIDIDNLDTKEIAYQCMEVAATMTDDIIRLAVESMMINASHQIRAKLKDFNSVIDSIKSANEIIKSSIGRSANFVVMPIGIAKIIKNEIITEYDFDALPTNIKRIGVLKNKWTVYINGYESNHMLIGYRGIHPVDAAYIYTPNLMFCDPKIQNTITENYIVFKRTQNYLVQPDYLACVEFKADKKSDSIEEF